MKIKKRHIVLSTLVLTLSAAVLINWQLSGTSQTNPDTTRELGVATYVNSNLSSGDEVAVSNLNVSVNSKLTKEQEEYFTSAKTQREKTQADVIALAQQVLELSESSEEAMEDAVEQLAKIEDNILSQNRIELTIKGKGFSECICCLDDTSCTIFIPSDEMTDSASIVIMDCVADVSGLPFENINIVCV